MTCSNWKPGATDLHYRLTLWVVEQGRHSAFGQNSSVLQQGSDEAPCGQLTQQVCQEFNKALAVQQLLLVLRTCQVCNFRLSFLHSFSIGFWCYFIQNLQALCYWQASQDEVFLALGVSLLAHFQVSWQEQALTKHCACSIWMILMAAVCPSSP